jgi:outer membrane protein TolC
VARAEEQLVVARARVLSGAEVQTDSLRLLLELTRARVDLLRETSRLRVSRLTLGRLIGIDGPVDAAPLDSGPAPDLPLTLEEAIAEAVTQGPTYRVVRANERVAGAQLWAQRSAWLPQIGLTAATSEFDQKIFPSATKRSTLSIGVSLPIWNGGQREIAITQARVNRDVARAIREDFERAARPDVTQAYDQYLTSRAATELALQAVVVAEENYRVQEARYRGGATDILDLLEAQVNLSDAQAGVVQARTATRLALAGLEAILGRRLFTGKE